MLGAIAAHYVDGGAGFTDPRSIPGLWAWYSAQAETSYADNADMTQWTDQSGNSRHALASGTNQPKWRSSLGRGGGPSVQFTSNGGTYFVAPNMTALTAGEGAATLYPTADPQGFWRFGASGIAPKFPHGGTAYDDFGSSVWETASSGVALNTWYRYGVAAESGRWRTWLDGTAKTDRASNTVSFRSNPNIGDSLDGGWGFGGQMGCVLIYNRVLTASERADLDAWLTANPSGGVP